MTRAAAAPVKAYDDGVYLLELAFDGSPDRLALRPAHRERLRVLHEGGRLVMAGPYGDESGALLVFDVSGGELDALVDHVLAALLGEHVDLAVARAHDDVAVDPRLGLELAVARLAGADVAAR